MTSEEFAADLAELYVQRKSLLTKRADKTAPPAAGEAPAANADPAKLWNDVKNVYSENPYAAYGLTGAGIGGLGTLIASRILDSDKSWGESLRDALVGAVAGGGIGLGAAAAPEAVERLKEVATSLSPSTFKSTFKSKSIWDAIGNAANPKRLAAKIIQEWANGDVDTLLSLGGGGVAGAYGLPGAVRGLQALYRKALPSKLPIDLATRGELVEGIQKRLNDLPDKRPAIVTVSPEAPKVHPVVAAINKLLKPFDGLGYAAEAAAPEAAGTKTELRGARPTALAGVLQNLVDKLSRIAAANKANAPTKMDTTLEKNKAINDTLEGLGYRTDSPEAVALRHEAARDVANAIRIKTRKRNPYGVGHAEQPDSSGKVGGGTRLLSGGLGAYVANLLGELGLINEKGQ